MKNRVEFVMMAIVLSAAALLAARAASAQDYFNTHYQYPQKTGKQIFQGVCQACHMPGARGAVGAGAYPALAGDGHLAVASYPMAMVLDGFAAMPPFRDNLSDQQIANVINYIRTHFGNHFPDKLTAAAVRAMRSRIAAH